MTDELLLLLEIVDDRHLLVLVAELGGLEQLGRHVCAVGLEHVLLDNVLVLLVNVIHVVSLVVRSRSAGGVGDEGGNVSLDLERVLSLSHSKLLQSVLKHDLVHRRKLGLNRDEKEETVSRELFHDEWAGQR